MYEPYVKYIATSYTVYHNTHECYAHIKLNNVMYLLLLIILYYSWSQLPTVVQITYSYSDSSCSITDEDG